MALPLSVQEAINKIIRSQSLSHLQKARQDLTDRYHCQNSSQFMQTQKERMTYLATRMPATYGVCQQVFKILEKIGKSQNSISSLLDLGAGPGTVFLAAYPHFADLEKITLIEQDSCLIKLGKEILRSSLAKSGIMTWQNQTLLQAIPFAPHDLVTLSYVLGELSSQDYLKIIQAAWLATQVYLIIIEPGTPQGFEKIRTARQVLIEQGAYVMAPCPHEKSCPMEGNNWCHFSHRLMRTSSHRFVKQATLNYEDEKYSYIIMSRSPISLPQSRIICQPRRKSGHFLLDLCTHDGLKRHIVSKKMKQAYQQARQYEWGDPGPELGNNHEEQ